VAVDMIFHDSRFWVLDLNFQLGNRDWLRAGKDRVTEIVGMIQRGEL
jgi:hypothetical protein